MEQDSVIEPGVHKLSNRGLFARPPRPKSGNRPDDEPTHESDSPAKPNRTVLVIASRFPPVASAGAIRVRKFVKYLGEFGWQPVVITGATRPETTAAQDARRAADHESLRDLPPSTPIYRLSPVLDHWPSYAARACADRLGFLSRVTGVDQEHWEELLAWRFEGLHDRLAFPDRGIWRLPSAIRLATTLHRQYRFDAIFSSGMPFSDHLIGLAAHRLLRKPWLVDFRDPWVEYIHWQQWQSDWGHRLTCWAEAAVVRRAARVISVNDHMTGRFLARYGRLAAGKCVTIPNGFDPADFAVEREERPRAQFRLLYAGSLYHTRSPVNVLEAFRRFVAETPGSRGRIRFDFLGRPGLYADEFARESDGGAVRHLGMLPHSKALQEMADADANVLILPNLPGSENDTTTKLYEYLGSGRAILAAAPTGGAAAEALRGQEGVWLCDPDDVPALTQAIREMYRLWLAGKLRPQRGSANLEIHTRRRQARQLAEYLDAAVPSRSRFRGT